ncbi:MAG TPA: hypothetical protein VIN04_00340 [Myxococcota bacterium]
MSTSAAFDFVCEGLERGTPLDRLQCRGTVRLVLKEAGLDVSRVLPHEMAVVVERLLPDALRSRGVENPETLCGELARGLANLRVTASSDAPDAVFRRLGGG